MMVSKKLSMVDLVNYLKDVGRKNGTADKDGYLIFKPGTALYDEGLKPSENNFPKISNDKMYVMDFKHIVDAGENGLSISDIPSKVDCINRKDLNDYFSGKDVVIYDKKKLERNPNDFWNIKPIRIDCIDRNRKALNDYFSNNGEPINNIFPQSLYEELDNDDLDYEGSDE